VKKLQQFIYFFAAGFLAAGFFAAGFFAAGFLVTGFFAAAVAFFGAAFAFNFLATGFLTLVPDAFFGLATLFSAFSLAGNLNEPKAHFLFVWTNLPSATAVFKNFLMKGANLPQSTLYEALNETNAEHIFLSCLCSKNFPCFCPKFCYVKGNLGSNGAN
jgi:hypothetical protein